MIAAGTFFVNRRIYFPEPDSALHDQSMRLGNQSFWIILSLIAIIRLLAMMTMPLTDTSEARYGEIARLMVVSNDWITPWFLPGLPFWGKPPLSFWLQAASFELLGPSEFALRLPVFGAMALTTCLVHIYAKQAHGIYVARLGSLIFASMLLPLTAAGAVLTDPFLALGTTLAMVSIWMSLSTRILFWKYGTFIGLAIGLLAKGPLAAVLVAGATIAWVIWTRSHVRIWRSIPWMKGSLLTAVLVVPWYAAAELKTPGFLDYFIKGEHFSRFLDPGWKGDLYGTAHRRPVGMIWVYCLFAAMPWSLFGLRYLYQRWTAVRARNRIAPENAAQRDDAIPHLVCWALFTPIFFTFSGNVIWTYALPALPPVAIMLACLLLNSPCKWLDGYARVAISVVPVITLLFALAAFVRPNIFNTEKRLVASIPPSLSGPIYFAGRVPFSARFYTQGTARPTSGQQFLDLLSGGQRFLLAVPKKDWPDYGAVLAGCYSEISSSRRYKLVSVAGDPARGCHGAAR